MNKFEKKAFSRDDINNVILSLLAFEDAEMQAAYELWAGEDGRIDADDVFMHLHHGLPPILPDAVFQKGAVGAVIIHGCQAVVYLG